jgi:outer membrane biosynthesis protein TonB
VRRPGSLPVATIALWVAAATFAAALVWWVTWLPPSRVAPPPRPASRLPQKPRPVRSADAPPDEEGAPQGDEQPIIAVGTTELPELLERRHLEAAMAKVKPHVMACRDLEQFSGYLTVKLVVGRSGGVQSVHVVSPPARSETGDCVVKALRRLSFPRFRGSVAPTVEWTYPFLF